MEVEIITINFDKVPYVLITVEYLIKLFKLKQMLLKDKNLATVLEIETVLIVGYVLVPISSPSQRFKS